MIRYTLLLFMFTALAFGQIKPSITAITNAALPGMDAHVPTRLQPRSMATIFGTNLSTTTISTTPPWATTLGGIQIHLVPLYTRCGTSTPPPSLSCDLVASLVYVSPTQINFIVPDISPVAYGRPELAVDVVIVNSGQRLDSGVSFYVSPVGDFAIFQVGYDCDFALTTAQSQSCGYSQSPGQAEVPIGAITDASGDLITSQNPVHQGQIVVLWGTGLASLSFNQASGLIQQVNPSPLILGLAQYTPAGVPTLAPNWQEELPLWAGESPQYVGLDQINLAFPSCTGPAATADQRIDVLLTLHAPSADSSLGVGFATLYLPFAIGPGEPTCPVGRTTTTGISSSANPWFSGQPLILTATVSPSASTGTVTFSDGTTILGIVPLSAGRATCGNSAGCITSGLSAGTHSIIATYGGDTTFAASSVVLNQAITVTPSVSLSSASNPATFGQPVTLIGTVSPCCTATGTLSFMDGNTSLGSGLLAVTNGVLSASISASGLGVGTHSLTVHYGGDTYNTAVSSAPLMQTISQGKVSLTITYSPTPITMGQAVTFTVSLSNNTATGVVSLFDGTATIGSSQIKNGQAIFSTPSLSGGNHTITASYAGDTNFGSTFASLTLTVIVNKTPTTITVTSSVNPTTYQPEMNTCTPPSPNCLVSPTYLTLSANIVPQVPSEISASVSFYALTANSGNATPVMICSTYGLSCQVSAQKGNLSTGTSTITAVYSGDAMFLGSTSPPITEVVNMPVYNYPNPAVSGQTVTFTVDTGWPWSSTGVVTFYDGSTVIGSAVVSNVYSQFSSLNGNLATLQTSALDVGSHSISAAYAPTPGVVVATSQVVTQTVNAH